MKEIAKLLKQRGERLKPMIQERVKERNKDDYLKEERNSKTWFDLEELNLLIANHGHFQH